MTITENDLVPVVYDVELPQRPKCKIHRMETGDWFVRGPVGSMLNIYGKWEHFLVDLTSPEAEAKYHARTTFPSLSAAINAINKSLEQ